MSDHRPSSLRLYSLILLMIVCWSANFGIGKHVVRSIPPLLTVGMRTGIAALAMLLVYHLRTRGAARPWHARDLPLLLALGLLGVGANQLCFVVGLSQTSVSHAAVMIGLTPILVFVIAWLRGQEQLSTGRLVGMAIALAGVAVLQTGASSSRASSLAGDALVLLGAMSFAWFTVRSKAEIHRLGGVTVNMFGYAASAIAMIPITATLGASFDFAQIGWTTWLGLLYMALFSSVVCYLIFYYVLRYVPASRVSAFAYLQPLLATLIAIPVAGEYPSESLFTGGALVLAGVFATERF